ncbi:MAG: flagellar biosynthetic protein FliR [Armatimonadetes bacterium]|nr:flagellar biosynthetic protein FliR [Armatimonadota bacterium]
MLPELLSRTVADLLPFLPAMARIAAMVSLAPGFSFGQVPAQLRVMLALALAAIVAPAAGPASTRVTEAPENFLAALAGEVVIGAIIGLAAAIVIEAASYAASFIELQAGLRAGEVFDPAQAAPSSVLSRLYYLTAVLVFFSLNGHHVLIAMVCRSLEVLPPGEVVLGPTAGKLATHLVAASFWLALAMALPTIGALLLTDLAFGLVGRLVSNFSVFFVGLPAKLAVTIVGMAVSAPVVAVAVAQAIGLLSQLLGSLYR